jgi:hypothetical protein
VEVVVEEVKVEEKDWNCGLNSSHSHDYCEDDDWGKADNEKHYLQNIMEEMPHILEYTSSLFVRR